MMVLQSQLNILGKVVRERIAQPSQRTRHEPLPRTLIASKGNQPKVMNNVQTCEEGFLQLYETPLFYDIILVTSGSQTVFSS